MVVVDVSILNIALPSIADGLHASMVSLQWTLISYTVALTALVPFFGRVSDVLGRKRLFISGLLIFTAGSLLAALAHSVGWLITARIVQAVGGALITTNTLAIITDTFPAGKRGVAMGIQSILISGGAAIGPTLGGFLVTHFGWEAVFFVNLPVGLLAAVLAFKVLPPLQTHRTLEPIDWPGGILIIACMVPLMLALTKGSDWGWNSPLVYVLAGGGIVLLTAFIVWEKSIQHPIIDLSLFTNRSFTAGQLAGMFATISMSSMMFIMPFYWQGLRALDAQEAGLLMLPLPLTLMVVAPIAGRLSDLKGARWIASAGLLTIMAALYLISQITAHMPIWNVIWRFMVLGAGLGSFTAPNNNAIMSLVPPQKRGIASGLLGTFRFTGQSLGIAISGAVFNSMLVGASGLGSGELPSPEMIARIAQNALAMEAFEASFINAMRTVCLVVIPLAAIGLMISFSREDQSKSPSTS